MTEPNDLVSVGIDEDPEGISGEEVEDVEALGEYAVDALSENAVRLEGE